MTHCTYPMCNCPFDAPADPNWCARGLPKAEASAGCGERVMSANIEALVKKHSRAFSGDVRGLRAALTEQAETHALELRAYEATVQNLEQRIRQLEAQTVPVVGEPTDAAYKWMIANGVEPLTSLHKLGERLAAFLDEDQFSGCETLLLTAITAINTFVPVPAAELATLREKEKDRDALLLMMEQVEQERDELQKRAERMQKALSDIAKWTDHYATPGHPISTIARAAIAQGKGE